MPEDLKLSQGLFVFLVLQDTLFQEVAGLLVQGILSKNKT